MDLLVLSFLLARVMYMFADSRNNGSILFWIFIMVFFHFIFWYVRKDYKFNISKGYFINNIILYYLFYVFHFFYFSRITWYPLWEGNTIWEMLVILWIFWVFYIPFGLILRYYFLYKKRELLGGKKQVFLAFISELFLFYKK